MVISPQYVMYGEELYKVHKQIGNKLFLVAKTYKYRTGGWIDPRSGGGGYNTITAFEDYFDVDVKDCQPIDPSVADIMRGV